MIFRKIGLVIFIIISIIPAFAQNDNDLKIGLALRGGGALGFAHIGALSVIDSLDIPVDYVAGTSMGGLIGALYCMGYSVQEMEEFVLSVDWADIFIDSPSRENLPYHIKKQTGRYQLEMDVDGYTPVLPSGIVAGQKIYKLFFSVTYPYEGIDSFDDLPVPFRCLGADLVTGNEIIFKDGSLAKAMRSTMSIPSAFTPVRYDTALVIDGGMTNNFPVDVAQEMGANFVIGLNLVSAQKDADYYDGLMKIIDRTLDVPRKDKLQETVDAADLLIQQNITGYFLTDFDREKILQIINQGKIAAYEMLDDLIALKNKMESKKTVSLNNKFLSRIRYSGDPAFSVAKIEKILQVQSGKLYNTEKMHARLDRFNHSTILAGLDVSEMEDGSSNVILDVIGRKNLTPILKEVSVVGTKIMSDRFILNFLGLVPGRNVDIYKLEQSIALLYGLKYFSTIRFTIDQHDDETVSLTLEVVESSLNRFKFGIHYDDFYKLVGVIGISNANFLVPGLVLDMDFQFSGLTRFRTDIFYPTRSMDFPVYPLVTGGYNSIPRDVYNPLGQKALRYDEDYWFFAGGIGFTPWNSLNINTILKSEYPNIKLDIGDVELGEDIINENIIVLQADMIIDLLDDVLIPQNGLAFRANIEFSPEEFQSNYLYLRLESGIDFYKTIGTIHTFRLSGRYLQSWENEPLHKTTFFIGGPASFFGLAYNQGFGSRFTIARADYLIQFLQGVYLRSVVNAVPFYQLGLPPKAHTGPALWGFGFGIIYNTILGPFEIDFAWGEENTYDPGTYISRIFFTAGYNL